MESAPKSSTKINKEILGIIPIFISLVLFISFISYLKNWQIDQSIATEPLSFIDFFNTGIIENKGGLLGAKIAHIFIYNGFGISSFLIVFWMFLWGINWMFEKKIISLKNFLKNIFWMTWVLLCFGLIANYTENLNISGKIGYHFFTIISNLIGLTSTILLIVFTLYLYLSIKYKITPKKIKSYLKPQKTENNKPVNIVNEKFVNISNEKIDVAQVEDKKSNKKVIKEENIELVINENNESEKSGSGVVNYDPTLDLPRYKSFKHNLLGDYGEGQVKVDEMELKANKNAIIDTLSNFKIIVENVVATVGPTVTLYEMTPGEGIRISKIKSLEDDIALSLSALGIRIIAPIPGKGTIGIEVPNKNKRIVSLSALLKTKDWEDIKEGLPIAFGRTIDNKAFIRDLTKMPHLLMAGATGQGKSVGINTILTSILHKKHPSQIKFVLVDPKKVELSIYSKIEKHYLAKLEDVEEAIITDTSKVVNTLKSLCIEMDNRYDMLKDAHARNLNDYNKKFKERKLNPAKVFNGLKHMFLPYIVLVIDEFADLIMTAGKEVETPIARLAQLARAVGIHLIIATQRPSVNVITGLIKANFPTRIAFRVSSKIDSRTILDAGGADQLIGMGDMLYSDGNKVERIQCAFVDTPDVEKVVEHIEAQQAYPHATYLPEIKAEESAFGDVNQGEKDSLFEEAARIIVTHQQGSASLLQRKLKIGYNRAGRIIDQLEASGIIGPFDGSKARQVLIPDQISLEQLLNNK